MPLTQITPFVPSTSLERQIVFNQDDGPREFRVIDEDCTMVFLGEAV